MKNSVESMLHIVAILRVEVAVGVRSVSLIPSSSEKMDPPYQNGNKSTVTYTCELIMHKVLYP